jgi:hypothetical protein
MPAHLAVRDYVLDADDPRAPTLDQWERMSPDERKRVVDMLPSEVPERRADDLEQRVAEEQRLRAEEQRLRAEEQRLRAEEQRLRAEAEQKLAEALAEIDRLRRDR